MSGPSPASVKTAKEKLMKALAEFHSLGKTSPETKVVGKWAGYVNIDSKHVRVALKQLKEEGLIIRHTKGGLVELSKKGIAAMPKVEKPPSDAKLQRNMLKMILKEPKGLPSAENVTKVFNKLLDGKHHEKKSLVTLAGYAHSDSKGFRNLISRMQILGILETGDKKGSVRLSDTVFQIGGRPSGNDKEAVVPLEVPSLDGQNTKCGGKASSSSSGKRKAAPSKKVKTVKDAERKPGKKRKTLGGSVSGSP